MIMAVFMGILPESDTEDYQGQGDQDVYDKLSGKQKNPMEM